jgi:hypothetical protein
MARLSVSARRRHERELSAAFAKLLERQAARVAERLRHAAVRAAADDEEDWWDEEQAETESDQALRPAMTDAAMASAGAVASAYGATYSADPDLDSALAARAKNAAAQTATTTRKAFAGIIDDYDDENDAADAVERYGGQAGRASLIGSVEIAAALLLGGRAAISYLASRPDEDRVAAKTWILSPDHEAEDECDDNDGMTIAVDDDWPGGDPGDLHFGCQCEEDEVLVDASELTASASSPGDEPEVRSIAPMSKVPTPPAPPATVEGAVAAAAIAVHSTPTTDEAWDGQAAERALRNEDGATEYRQAYAWVNPAGNPDSKNSYWGPHHMVDDEGAVGAANVAACQRAIKALNGSRGASGVPAGDRQTVHNHLAHHLKEAGEDVPPLVAAASALIAELDQVVAELAVRGVTLPMTRGAQGQAIVDLEALGRMLRPPK